MPILLVTILDYAGVALFAATGALVAAERRQDLLTFIFFAAITGVGGGTLRDLLIGAPVFWVADPGYIVAATVAAILVWLSGARLPEKTILWLDALGLCVYAVVGAAKAQNLGVSPPIAVVMGVLTCTFGGIIRDVLAGVPSILLRREIYISAALVSATVFVVLHQLGLQPVWASAIAIPLGFAVRAGAILWRWSLPPFEPPEKKKP